MFEKIFKLKENKTNFKTEILAGLTTFMTMAYILAVNPNLLSAAGMDRNAVFMATALSAGFATLVMAFVANHPFALAPGMGLNAFFAFTVCGIYGISWQVALFAVFIEGIIFIILSLTNVREAIFNAIPTPLKHAISAGIGLFIAFIGLQGAKIITHNDSTLVQLRTWDSNFRSQGIGAILAIIGIVIIAVLLIKKVKGAILIGIIATWVLGIIAEKTGLYIPNVEAGMFSTLPSWDGLHFSSLGKTFGQAFDHDWSNMINWNFIMVVFSFLFVDMFDTIGTLVGVASKADMLDKDGKLPRIKGALLADAVGTTAGAVLGTSTVTTYVESASGVTEGGRTGLTSFTTGILFLLSIFLSPIFVAIPSFATAPALIIVGFYMIAAVLKIDFNDMTDGIPAFLTLIGMGFAYSISEGIAFGVISYTVINLIAGNAKKKKISLLMYILTVLFILKYIFL